MNADDNNEREERINEVIADYLDAIHSGSTPRSDEFIELHPDMAPELIAFFADREKFQKLASPIPGPSNPDTNQSRNDMSRDSVASDDASLTTPMLAPDKELIINGLDAEQPTMGMAAIVPTSVGSHVHYFGDYELLDEIARGGMGIVYKARQKSLKRIVALKMILTGQLASSEDVKRFYAEAEAAAKLEHPNIVPIYEIGQTEGQHYFSMALVDGESLAHRVAREVIAPMEAASIMHKVARAIAYAHVEGVVHRDLKPANILLDIAGEPHVTDFGLAKRYETAGAANEASQLTATGQVLGTPSYMPPEQASGKVKSIGPLSDVYSLGAVLYCLITGRPPFQAASPLDTLLQVLDRDPVSPRLLNPAIPRDLETICMKCLNKEPESRYASAGELADDLDRFVRNEPIQARPPDVLERAWRWMSKQRRSVALTAAAVAATLVLAAAGMATWLWYQDYRLGYLSLGTDRPPLAAEIVDDSGQAVAKSFTVPTQEPVPVPAGEYTLRLSAEGRMSQLYRVSVLRGASTVPLRHSLNIEDQILGSPLKVDRSYAIVNRQGRQDVLLLNPAGVHYTALLGSGPVSTNDLTNTKDDPVLREFPGFLWQWNTRYYAAGSLVDSYFHPMVVESASDLDGDGIGDAIVAARHQGWIVALPSRGGGPLWVAARGTDLKTPRLSDSQSGVVCKPIVINDLDGDGISELIAVFCDLQFDGQMTTPHRWIECLSGKSLATIWQFDLKDELFQMPPGVEWSESARWFTQITGSSGSGSGSGWDRNNFLRSRGVWLPSGNWHPMPFQPQLVLVAGKQTLVSVLGQHVLGIDPVTGQPRWEPFDLGFHPIREPQLAQLAGDAEPELVLLESAANASGATSVASTIGGLKISSWSLNGRRMNWRHALSSEWRKPSSENARPEVWPVIEDLDGDGSAEIIVPTGSHINKSAWGEIESLNGRTGETRWRHAIKTMDQQLDRFLVGPDINRDGHRDVFVATLFSRDFDLYMDAISGNDGKTIWWSSKARGPSHYEYDLGDCHLWESGSDGAPQILVELQPKSRDLGTALIHSFSCSDGKFLGSLLGIDRMHVADADADGLPDLFTFQLNNWRDQNSGGSMRVIRGAPVERWRRLGGVWQPGSDYNADGHDDLLRIEQDGFPKLRAASGMDGRLLWMTQLDQDLFDGAIPLSVDLNKDGTNDVIVYHASRGARGGSIMQEFPLSAVSGRDGTKLWSVPVPFAAIEGVPLGEAHDLDNDGVAEIIFSAFTDWDYDRSKGVGTNMVQHWLAVVSGSTGQVRWRKPLSVAYGKSGQPTNRQYQTQYLQMEPCFADLDGDGVQDVIVPAETVGSQNLFESQALSGRDGKVLWRRPISPDMYNNNNRWGYEDAVSPITADIDGDGKLDVIGLEYVMQLPQENNSADVQRGTYAGEPQRIAKLFALDASDGREKWSYTVQVENQCGRVQSNGAYLANKPKPILVRKSLGSPMIALGLWGFSNPGKILLVSGDGKKLGEMPQPESIFKPWVHDANGDGNDDLIVKIGDKLLAVKANAEMQMLWEWTIPQGQSQILSITPASGVYPAVIALKNNNSIYGISAKSGQPIWINRGPQPLAANGTALESTARLLDSRSDAENPSAVFQFGEQVCVCREATPLHNVQHQPPTKEYNIKLTGTRSTGLDPRLIRHPAWSPDNGERIRGATMMMFGVFFSVIIVVLPGWTFFRMIERRRFTLRALMLLPVIAAIVLFTLQIPGPSNLEQAGWSRSATRLVAAIMFLPVPVFALVLLHLWRTRRWGWLTLYCFGIVCFGCLISLALTGSQNSSSLMEGEHLVLSDLDIPLAYGYYTTGIMATFATGIVGLQRMIFGPHRSVKRSSVP